MKKVAFLLFAATLAFYLWKNNQGIWQTNAPIPEEKRITQNLTNLPLNVPAGYSILIYAKNLGNPRDLTIDPKGVVLASITGQGKVVAIVNGGAVAVAEGLNKPHGLAFSGNKLYIAETDQVAVYDYDLASHKAVNKRKIIDLPSGGGHFTRSLLVRDGKLYVSVGSSCDTCVESDARRAAIWWANLDGSDFKPFATGLRNSVFIATNPNTNEIWATEMGRDFLGDDIPPDEVNIIKEGQFYGWPYCWGDGNPDKNTNRNGAKFNCAKSINPQIKLQAHSAPLGLAFLGGDLLVAYHGSWNRSVPTGYKVVKFHNGAAEDFITGWLEGSEVLGRPVDILVKGSEIYISDDKAGVIYLLKSI